MSELKPFWYYSKPSKLELNRTNFFKWMNNVGFKYDKDSGGVVKTTETNKTLYDTSNIDEVFTYILNHLDTTKEEEYESGRYCVKNDDGDAVSKTEVLELWMEKGKSFTFKSLDSKILLEKFSNSNIFRDNYEECYLSFKNGIVKITKKKIELLEPSVIGKKYRYSNSLLQNHNKQEKWDGAISIKDPDGAGEFEMFCKVSTSKKLNDLKKFDDENPPHFGKDYELNEGGLKCLMSSIGYLVHRKMDTGQGRMVLLQDRVMDGKTRSGGNGKGLIANALRCVVPLEEIHGETSTSNDKFLHGGVTMGTRVVFYDELVPKRGLQVGELYTNITSQMKIERKNQNSFILRGDDVPKLLAASNYLVFDSSSSSDMRRLHIVEFSDLGSFHKGHINTSWNSKKSMFGNNNDWGQKDWNDFYNFIFKCVQVHLTEGLYKEHHQNWERQHLMGPLIIEFGQLEVLWMEKYLKSERKVKSHHLEDSCPFSFELYNSLLSQIPNTRLDETRMKKMFYDYCESSNGEYEYNPSKKHHGDSPNLRKIQRTFKNSNGKSEGQKHCIHITNIND